MGTKSGKSKPHRKQRKISIFARRKNRRGGRKRGGR